VILLCGIPTETPLAMVRSELDELGEPYVLFNQRRFAEASVELGIAEGRVSGRLRLNGDQYALADFGGIYSRMMDYRFLPELKDEAPDTPKQLHCRNLLDTLTRWAEIAPARVVNRIAPTTSNFSKPYQTQLIRQYGFEVPETLITNDPELVRAFRARHGQIIYKSISGVRSIVQTFGDEDLARLELIRWCPTQFQAYVPGMNVRVHTVGREVFPTAISTDATDYRYASRQTGDPAALREVELSDELAEMCINLAAGLGLAFAGIDLKITPDRRIFCFEVNPSPAFSYYESHTGQPIARAVARYLAGAA
jgi:glutathione synthase/RimK-type ligase-like ATP-grasp enzyme